MGNQPWPQFQNGIRERPIDKLSQFIKANKGYHDAYVITCSKSSLRPLRQKVKATCENDGRLFTSRIYSRTVSL